MSQRLDFIRPALAVPAKAPPKGDQWVHEAKWDGYRCQVVKDGKDVRLYSKQGTEWTKKLPAIAAAFAELPARTAIFDCELCHAGADGRPEKDAWDEPSVLRWRQGRLVKPTAQFNLNAPQASSHSPETRAVMQSAHGADQ